MELTSGSKQKVSAGGEMGLRFYNYNSAYTIELSVSERYERLRGLVNQIIDMINSEVIE